MRPSERARDLLAGMLRGVQLWSERALTALEAEAELRAAHDASTPDAESPSAPARPSRADSTASDVDGSFNPVTFTADEAGFGGPPAHWLEKVRRGAPGLLFAQSQEARAAPRPHQRGLSPRDGQGSAESFVDPGHGAAEQRRTLPPATWPSQGTGVRDDDSATDVARPSASTGRAVRVHAADSHASPSHAPFERPLPPHLPLLSMDQTPLAHAARHDTAPTAPEASRRDRRASAPHVASEHGHDALTSDPSLTSSARSPATDPPSARHARAAARTTPLTPTTDAQGLELRPRPPALAAWTATDLLVRATTPAHSPPRSDLSLPSPPPARANAPAAHQLPARGGAPDATATRVPLAPSAVPPSLTAPREAEPAAVPRVTLARAALPSAPDPVDVEHDPEPARWAPLQPLTDVEPAALRQRRLERELARAARVADEQRRL